MAPAQIDVNGSRALDDGRGAVHDMATRMEECSVSPTGQSSTSKEGSSYRRLDETEEADGDGEAVPPGSAGVVDGMRDMSISSVAAGEDQDRDGGPSEQQETVVPTADLERQAATDNVPLQLRRRPFDDVRDAGRPTDPLPFPPPQYSQARRADRVLCYDEVTGRHFEATDVLFRVEREGEGVGCADADDLSRVERAYWRMPDKVNIETRMGHLEKCHVLRRLPKSDDSDDDDAGCNDDDDDDVVFLLTDELVAIKVNYIERMQRLCGNPRYEGENPLVEIAALLECGTDHPNVLGCHEALYDGEFLSVVMPYCDGGDLHDAVVRNAQSQNVDAACGLPEAEAKRWFRQFLEGLRHLQAKGMCHRDLSPENLILRAGQVLIIDMGMCLRVPFSSSVGGEVEARGTHRRLMLPQGQVGKFPYMSPEVYLNREGFDGFAIDLWTAGTILFFLLTGTKYEHPFDVIFKAMTQDLTGLLVHWNIQLSENAIDLIQGLIRVDPRLRLTLDEALGHPWLTATQVGSTSRS